LSRTDGVRGGSVRSPHHLVGTKSTPGYEVTSLLGGPHCE
jgi:hypothetical protein